MNIKYGSSAPGRRGHTCHVEAMAPHRAGAGTAPSAIAAASISRGASCARRIQSSDPLATVRTCDHAPKISIICFIFILIDAAIVSWWIIK